MKTPRRTASPPGSIRIIGGQWRSRRIVVPPTSRMRPTPDRVRETLFNWLAELLPGARCLDLFAGTGALGLEALSRGAAHAVFIERDRTAAAALRTLCEALGASADVVQADALQYPVQVQLNDFDIVFVDPPYEQPVDDLLVALTHALPKGARVYLERSRDDAWPPLEAPHSWQKQSAAAAVAFGLAVIG